MRKVAGLAAVAVVLAAYLLFGDRHPESGVGGSTGRARLIDPFDRAAVRRITIRRAGAAPFSLERQAPGSEPSWREAPGDQPADGAIVEDLLNAIDLAETTRTADVGAAVAGLTPPRLTIEIELSRGPVTIELGRLDAAGQGVFARAGGVAAIRVAPRRLADLSDREPWSFRDRRLVPLAAEAITAVGWRKGAGDRREQRLGLVGGRWQNGDGQWVAGERVAEALRRLLALRVVRYQPPQPAPPAPSRIDLEAAGGVAIHLWFPSVVGAACATPPGALVEREGPAGSDGACLAPEAIDELWPALEASSAPDLRLVSSSPEAVTRVEMTEGARRLVLARLPGGAWHFEAPKVGYPADPGAIGAWLAALRGLEIQPTAVTSARPPQIRRLTIEGRTRETVSVSPGDAAYASLDPEPLRFRDRLVLDFAHFDARDLKRTAAGQTVELTSIDGDRWQVVAPSGAAADRTNVARVVGALGNLRVEAFIPSEKAPSGPPELSLAIAFQPPGEAAASGHTLELYKKKEAPGCTGRLDREVAFTLAPAVCDELRLGLLN